jgi:hypothetical protein
MTVAIFRCQQSGKPKCEEYAVAKSASWQEYYEIYNNGIAEYFLANKINYLNK